MWKRCLNGRKRQKSSLSLFWSIRSLPFQAIRLTICSYRKAYKKPVRRQSEFLPRRLQTVRFCLFSVIPLFYEESCIIPRLQCRKEKSSELFRKNIFRTTVNSMKNAIFRKEGKRWSGFPIFLGRKRNGLPSGCIFILPRKMRRASGWLWKSVKIFGFRIRLRLRIA